MINIQENYGSMTDQQLIQIENEDFEHLTPEAKSALRCELQKRNIKQTDNNTQSTSTSIPLIILSQIPKDTLTYILEQKEKGQPSIYIIGGLIERGYDEEDAIHLLNQLPTYIQNRLKEMSSFILSGILLFTAGLSIKMLPLSKESHLAIIILANVLMGAGIMRFFHGYLNKKRFSKMKQERIDQPLTLEQL